MRNDYPSYEIYAGGHTSAAQAEAAARRDFIRKTYAHLAVAILGFILLCTLIVESPLAPKMMEWLGGSQYSWLIVLGGFMAVGWIAERWAQSASSTAMQYLGLGLYVVAEAFVFTPLLFIATYYSDANVLPTAALLTALVFIGLTGTVFIMKTDFSFLRGVLAVVGLGAMGLIVASILFGFTLGTIFSAVMVVFAAGYILYYTSNVLHHYPVGAHVAAALALFSAVALLFWYILRLVMSLNRD